MPNDGSRLLAAYKQMDKVLVRKGWHPTSPAWMEALSRFWLSGRTRMVVRKGRQSGFSTTMARVAVCTGLYGEHRVTPGTRLAVPFVSIKVDEARERLHNIGDIVDALGVHTRRTNDSIEVVDNDHPPIVWRTLACSFRTAVGLTAVAAVEDEMARWTNEDGSANPAPEVDAAISPMLVTQPNARIYSGSSPLATEDFHAELFARGDTDDQLTFEGPSWHWNPSITEAATHRLQADPKIWAREFAAVPGSARSAAFEPAAIDAAFAHPMPKGATCERRVILDPSSGKKDAFTMAAAGWVMPEGAPPYLRVYSIASFGDSFWGRLSGEDVADKIKRFADEWECRHVHADQREAFMLRGAIEKRGLTYHVHDWTAQSKPLAVERVRRWFAEGTIALPEHAKLRRELLMFEERITPTGQFTFGARGGKHDDFVALLITAAMAEISRDLIPVQKSFGVYSASDYGRWGEAGWRTPWGRGF